MDATARSAAVLAAAALLVVPIVNALVLESQSTADRQVTDPPEDPPPRTGETPGKTRNTTRDLPEGRRAGGGNCTPVPEDAPAAQWRHPAPQQGPGAAVQARAQSPDERSFRISDLHPAARVQLNASGLAGSLTASVYPAGEPGNAPFEVDVQRAVPADLARGHTLTRAGDLVTGDWVATLDTDQASYQELTFTVVRAICEEAAT